MNTSLKTVSDLADILGCQKITVYRLVKLGKIPHRRIGTLLRFTDSDIQSYLDSVRVERTEGAK